MFKKGFSWFLSRLPFYFLFFVCPILGMMNCEGWNEGTMAAKTCLIDTPILHAYANFYYGFIAISSFMIFFPVFMYIAICIWVSDFFGKMLDD